MEEQVRALRSKMDRLNFPSKNPVYAMGRALFTEYELFCFQDSYFREMKQPNPSCSSGSTASSVTSSGTGPR